MAPQVLGVKLTLSPTTYLFTASTTRQQVVTSTVIVVPSGGWITSIGVWARKVSSAPRLALGIWQIGSDGLPGTLLARTNPVTIGAAGNVEIPIVWTNPTIFGGKATALRVDPNQKIYLGWVTSSGQVEVGQDPGVDVTWWAKDNTTSLPLNPFGAPSEIQSVSPVRLYCLFNDATKPTVALFTPAAGAPTTDDAPTFIADVTDVDFTPYGDTIQAYDIQVREQGTAPLLWNARFLASLTEQNAKRITREYAGPDLVGGHTYEWQVRAQDMAGEWSDFTAYRAFLVSDIGMVDVSTFATPTGKVDGNSAAITWSARWWHTVNLAATHVQVQILTSNGAILKTGPIVAKTIAAADEPPGTDFTVTALEAGLGELPYGKSLRWQIRAQASNGVWSGFSTPIVFSTNAIPTTPNLISPVLNGHSTSRPRLVIASEDPDADDLPLTDVVWDFEIQEVETGTVRTALADAYDLATKQPSFQTTATEVPTPGQFLWRARGRDLSAGLYGIGAWSSPWFDFRYGTGPEITITNPAEGEWQLTTTVRVDWTSDDDQSAYQVWVYPVNPTTGVRGAAVSNSGKIASATTFYDVPVGRLKNNTTYDVIVWSWDLGGVQGISAPRRFLISYVGPEGLADVTVVVQAVTGDIEPTTPLLSWVGTKSATFVAYIVRRWDGPLGLAATFTTLAELTNPLQTTFRDYHAPPNTPLTYSVAQRIRLASGALQESAETAVEVRVDLTTPVVAAIGSPAALRFPVVWLGRNLAAPMRRRRSTYQTWGTGGVPTSATAPGAQKLRQVSFTITTDQWGTLAAHRAAIEAVILAGVPVSWRDEYERIFADIADYSIQRGELGQMEVSLQLEQIAYREGA